MFNYHPSPQCVSGTFSAAITIMLGDSHVTFLFISTQRRKEYISILKLRALKIACTTIPQTDSHFSSTGSVNGSVQSASSLYKLDKSHDVYSRIWILTTTEYLPHSHSVRPLQGYWNIEIYNFGELVETYHICFLCEDGIVETFQCHPLVGQLDISSFILSKISSAVHVFSQSKVTNSDITTRVQPEQRVAVWVKCS